MLAEGIQHSSDCHLYFCQGWRRTWNDIAAGTTRSQKRETIDAISRQNAINAASIGITICVNMWITLAKVLARVLGFLIMSRVVPSMRPPNIKARQQQSLTSFSSGKLLPMMVVERSDSSISISSSSYLLRPSTAKPRDASGPRLPTRISAPIVVRRRSHGQYVKALRTLATGSEAGDENGLQGSSSILEDGTGRINVEPREESGRHLGGQVIRKTSDPRQSREYRSHTAVISIKKSATQWCIIMKFDHRYRRRFVEIEEALQWLEHALGGKSEKIPISPYFQIIDLEKENASIIIYSSYYDDVTVSGSGCWRREIKRGKVLSMLQTPGYKKKTAGSRFSTHETLAVDQVFPILSRASKTDWCLQQLLYGLSFTIPFNEVLIATAPSKARVEIMFSVNVKLHKHFYGTFSLRTPCCVEDSDARRI